MINTSHGKSVGKYHMVIRVKGIPSGTRVKHNSEGCEKLEKVAMDSRVK